MIPQMPIYLLDVNQVDSKWVDAGLGIEGNIFNGRDLIDVSNWNKIEKNIKSIASLEPKKFTLHFPTDNSNYLQDKKIYEDLLRMIELASKYNVSGITLHANQFVNLEEYSSLDIVKRRGEFLDFLDEIDASLESIWLGVENLPIIGNCGDDYDPIFIYPNDFKGFSNRFNNIGITWDLCHWGITYLTRKSISDLLREENPNKFSDFDKLEGINHLHFSSFKNLALPYSSVKCIEGVIPEEGDIDEDLYVPPLIKLNNMLDKDVGIVFEVQEEDYYNRKNIWKTLDWFNNKVLKRSAI